MKFGGEEGDDKRQRSGRVGERVVSIAAAPPFTFTPTFVPAGGGGQLVVFGPDVTSSVGLKRSVADNLRLLGRTPTSSQEDLFL